MSMLSILLHVELNVYFRYSMGYVEMVIFLVAKFPYNFAPPFYNNYLQLLEGGLLGILLFHLQFS